jgi:hypothetical protein
MGREDGQVVPHDVELEQLAGEMRLGRSARSESENGLDTVWWIPRP